MTVKYYVYLHLINEISSEIISRRITYKNMKQLLVMALISMLCTAAPGIITCNTIHTGQQGEKKNFYAFVSII